MKDFTEAFLNNKSWWFNCKPEDDKYIVETYIDLLYSEQANPRPTCHHGILKQIILFDQIPRHIERHTKDIGYKHIIDFYLFTKAYPLAIEYLKYEQCTKAIELCFILLPIRHTKNINNHFLAIETVWTALIEQRFKDISHLRMFLKASYKKIPILTEHDKNTIIFIEKGKDKDKANLDIKDVKHILDPRSFEDKCILTPNKIADISLQMRKKMSDFIVYHKLQNKTIIISLSGGVDSMVCSYALSVIKRDFNITIKHVHINYMNREYTLEEEMFLTKWCNFIGSDLYIRRIHEINRKQCIDFDLRDTYESYTKEVRFDMYRYCNSYDKIPLIMLGHNEGDCFENILTNIINQSHYEDLDGMLPYSIINNVCLLRPLLKTSKNEIYDYERSKNIPFLVNSTPAWSQRGKIRDNIVPVLNAYNINAIPSILHLSKEVKEIYTMVGSFAAMYFSKFVNVLPNHYTYIMNINDLQTSSILWSGVLRHINMHISHKALSVLNLELEQFKCKFTTLENKYSKRITVNKYTYIKVEKKQPMICAVSIVVNI